MPKIASEGTCTLCGGSFSKAAMTRHVRACLKKRTAPAANGKKQKTIWLVVEGSENPEYWLHLDVPSSNTLADLDQFLRDLWLECCGHLSAFTINKVRYELDTGMVDSMWKDFFGPSMPTKSMKTRLYSILKPGLKFHHEYDFGTTTWLTLKVVAERERDGQSGKIRILARNNPPNIPCYKCGNPATQVCAQCIYDGPKAWLCDQHTYRHRCGEDMFLPVVNSPRVGMCGYTGNTDW